MIFAVWVAKMIFSLKISFITFMVSFFLVGALTTWANWEFINHFNYKVSRAYVNATIKVTLKISLFLAFLGFGTAFVLIM